MLFDASMKRYFTVLGIALGAIACRENLDEEKPSDKILSRAVVPRQFFWHGQSKLADDRVNPGAV
jgi:hypothetical protein